MMIKPLRFLVFFLILFTPFFAGCSYIRGYLPDKQKDYHYSQEIPPLKVPADLSSNQFETYQETVVNKQTETISNEDQLPGGELDALDESVTQATAVTSEITTNAEGQIVDAEVAGIAEKNTVSELEQNSQITSLSEPDTGPETSEIVSSTDKAQEDQDPWDISLDERETPSVDDVFEEDKVDTTVEATEDKLPEMELPEQQIIEESLKSQTSVTDIENMIPDSIPAVPLSESALKNQKIRYLVFNDGSNRIQIDEDVSASWRLVGKAISRNSIEITGRHREQLQFIVQYEPDEQPYEDGSLWDEFVFFFSGDQRQEKEYHVQLVDGVNYTEVLVSDEYDVPAVEGDGIVLLQLLYRTIKAELDKTQNL